MLFFPDRKAERRFLLLARPLPNKLLPFLFSRGLGIFVLPADKNSAFCFLKNQLRSNLCPLHTGALPWESAHYCIPSKRIILPHFQLFTRQHNVFLHEIGHALDFLYYGSSSTLHAHPSVSAVLNADKPLDSHCKDSPIEQFATSFASYFNEDVENTAYYYHTVHDLHPKLVGLIRKNFIEPFES